MNKFAYRLYIILISLLPCIVLLLCYFDPSDKNLYIFALCGISVALTALFFWESLHKHFIKPLGKLASLMKQIAYKGRNAEQDTYMHTILDAQSGLIAIVHKGQVLDCNKRFLHFFDVQNSKQFHKQFATFGEIFKKAEDEECADYELLRKGDFSSLLTQKREFFKVFLKHKEGAKSFSLKLDLLKLEGKEYLLFVFDDALELEKRNAELEKYIADEIEKIQLKERIANEQMRRSAMSELLINIAHQWRQPLNNIGILVQDIEDMYRFSELSQADLERNVYQIMQQIHGLSRMISKFTGFYDKKDTLEFFTLCDAIEHTVSLFESGVGIMDIQVLVQASSELSIYNNPQAFEEILMVLLVNAKEAFEVNAKEHGTITIRAEKSQDSNGGIVLECEDDAGGIPKEMLHKIFDPYSTTKFQAQGVGLGLYMARSVIEGCMYGDIEVRNTSRGACFRLTIPDIKKD